MPFNQAAPSQHFQHAKLTYQYCVDMSKKAAALLALLAGTHPHVLTPHNVSRCSKWPWKRHVLASVIEKSCVGICH